MRFSFEPQKKQQIKCAQVHLMRLLRTVCLEVVGPLMSYIPTMNHYLQDSKKYSSWLLYQYEEFHFGRENINTQKKALRGGGHINITTFTSLFTYALLRDCKGQQSHERYRAVQTSLL